MTSKPTRQDQAALRNERFPDFPSKGDMQNFLYLHRPALPAALDRHFGIANSTAVLGEAPVRWAPRQPRGQRIPDLLVAFNVDRDRAVRQMGYSLREQGKPPDFVFEMATVNAGFPNYNGKKTEYAAFGVPEYWRFDPTGGQRHDAHLAGDRLVNGEYQPIEIVQLDATHYYGRSKALGLYLCWEEGVLRFWDPVQEQYLQTFDEVAEGRVAAEREREAERNARIAAENERVAAENREEEERRVHIAAENERVAAENREEAKRGARLAAERERGTESNARIAAERERDAAERARLDTERRIRELEAELERRQQA